MRKRISILGSTGSIGRQTLDVISGCGFQAVALTANRDVARMEEQCRQFRPELAVMMDPEAAQALRIALADTSVRVASGMEGLIEAASLPAADTVVTAVVGMIGLRPTLAAIRAGKRIALANKETLVCAGQLVMDEAARCGVDIVPVDSEHSAIFQCLQGCRDRGEVKRLILTASGGPFWGKTREELEGVTVADALHHPNWSMGAKITVDSATMMNKGLEFIEAMRLYRLPPEKISVLIHRQSIVHSLVEYCDNAVLAQLGTPDMRVPIEYALTWPNRGPAVAQALDLTACGALTFAPPDDAAFPSLPLAIEAAKRGGTATAILNGANEAAVGRFLAGEIGFLEIPALVAHALETVPVQPSPDLETILAADQAARRAVQ
ncbi:1-deoxy-D-xylulose-5-phosphate reductoisomerase [Pseudoflavonifractor phocaeensis]|uniref:1-deoxy-D-xylulose-5-phosphate reductoisomerase n=1 Tax=Pseudoflavonifractor phocaeensis TaxID=1870988 RepID=UPI00195D74A6|nr:1-deoxy-D-xylulose-5-phosphate reductoisomerase [Pseudoflavonifractor phocaeensis]MBM6870770.1 1-deoxy-D-xylulose-5-phosphate reductoisomerase [Pseudoflavonifractor phocaeensis]